MLPVFAKQKQAQAQQFPPRRGRAPGLSHTNHSEATPSVQVCPGFAQRTRSKCILGSFHRGWDAWLRPGAAMGPASQQGLHCSPQTRPRVYPSLLAGGGHTRSHTRSRRHPVDYIVRGGAQGAANCVRRAPTELQSSWGAQGTANLVGEGTQWTAKFEEVPSRRQISRSWHCLNN